MNSLTKIFLSALAFSAFFTLTSCDEDCPVADNNNTEESEPRLSSMIIATDDDGEPRKMSYEYDDAGNLSSVILDIIDREEPDYQVRFDSIVYLDDRISEIHGIAEKGNVDLQVLYTYEDNKTTIDFIATPNQEKNTRVVLEYDEQDRLVAYSNEPLPQNEEPFVDQYWVEYMDNDMSMMYFIEQGDTIKQYQKYSYVENNPMSIYHFLSTEYYDGMGALIFTNSGLITEVYESEEDYQSGISNTKFEYNPNTMGYPTEIKVIDSEGRDFVSWYFTYE